MQYLKKFILVSAIALLLFTSVATIPSSAQNPQPPEEPDDLALLEAYTQRAFPDGIDADLPYSPNLVPDLLAKAEPDECFNGYPGMPYDGTPSIDCVDSPYTMTHEVQPKVNQAYVWGLTQNEDDLWFGTAPNVHCLVVGMYMGITPTTQTDSYVCEFGDSQLSPPMPPGLGDWRPPDGFRYDIDTGMLQDVHPVNYPSATLTDTLRFTNTLGLRSAGTYHADVGPITNTVFLAGPSAVITGVNVFAYDADTYDFIGSTTLISYTNIRKWVEIDGELYTGVARTDGSGAVLKYVGDPNDPATLFEFEEVGLPAGGSDVAELALHDGRLFVATWPTFGSMGIPATLWMSPEIPPGGLTSAHMNAWTPVWQYGSYDPNPATALSTGGGALISFDGYLYWGTMHVPMLAAVAHLQQAPPDPSWDLETQISYIAASVMGNHRAISVFRGRDFGTASQDVELLYGEAELPAFVDNNWVVVPNAMGEEPLYGSSGFGNFFNNYTWTMSLLHDELYVGTMDWSYLVAEGFTDIFMALVSEILGYPVELPPGLTLPLPNGTPGADLWRFRDVDNPAELLDDAGVGNPTNYGVRTMLTSPDDRLFLGSANPMNLLTVTGSDNDDFYAGGWELIEMVEIDPYPDLVVTKSDNYAPAPVPLGEVFTYTIQVTNWGYGEATNVRVYDTLPVSVTYNNGNPDCIESVPGELMCTLGDMLPYDGVSPDIITTEFTVTAPSEPTWLHNSVNVTNNRGDDNWDDNESTLLTSVDYITDFEISKTASADTVVSSDFLTYTLTITNNGPDDFASLSSLVLPQDTYFSIPSVGPAYPYPAEMPEFDGIGGTVESVRVTLDRLTHSRTSDLNVMLVSPENTKVMLMSGAGGGLNFNQDLVLVFDDEAENHLPQVTGILSGTYKPTDYSGINLFPLPAPIGPISDTLAAFEGDDPNGTWELFVYDSNLLYSGQIENGWTLDLTIKRTVTVSDTLPAGLILTNTVAPDWDCSDLSGIATCTRDTFASGDAFQIDLVSEYDFIDAESFTNSAEVMTGAFDPVEANNTTEVSVGIKMIYKLWLPLIFK